MKLRTVTKQNGGSDQTEREMHFGWDVLGTVAGIVAAGFAAWLSLRMDLKTVQVQQIEDNAHLPLVIRDAITTHDEGKQYVTRDELDRAMVPR